MKYRIIHQTEYNFSKPVFLEPHFLKFKPQSIANQQLLSFKLTLNPNPKGLTEISNPENNITHLSWFEGKHSLLHVNAVSEVEMNEFNPFDFLIIPEGASKIGFNYPSYLKNSLAPFSKTQNDLPIEIKGYAEKILRSANEEVLSFLSHLTTSIHSDFEKIIRVEGEALTPEETYKTKHGSCRDLAVLFIEICRAHKLAARFVSGYLFDEELEDSHELHAWAEVYLPGAGWRGFDPSIGLAVFGRHITVAASHKADLTLPVSGSYRGEASSDLKAAVEVIQL